MSSAPSKYKETSSRCPFPGETTECEAANDKSQPQSLNSHARSRSKKTFNPQLILENNGSVARDHLASERTFLAYVRTSLAIASTGVALVQLLTISVSTNGSTTSLTTEPTSQRMQAYAKPLGSAFVIFSIVLLITGLTRYFSIQNALTLNQFPVARLMIIISSLILGALVIFTFAILVAGQS
ncbi:uncharacterized protein C8R40DRAFT_1054512 [Lentinula edodes]|uniref:uncharacterized protein n=1 Tax=Lentinula edodes TaxID=5353 RepID=UPI001E8D4A31|nr:uncharacterized protein C8R40DRAFT_1054512 [Lentinula edodes]KAH7871383.1 hypothetical protein C8R40DRAFT_1054512 [Lentinula edodes]